MLTAGYFMLVCCSDSSDTQPNVALKSQSSSSITSNIESSGNIYTNAGSTSSGSLGGSGNAGLPNFNISYVFPESNKLAKNAKRQYESQVSELLHIAVFIMLVGIYFQHDKNSG